MKMLMIAMEAGKHDFSLGSSGGQPLRSVRGALHRMGIPVAFLDQRAVLDTEIELSVDSDIRGSLRTIDVKIMI